VLKSANGDDFNAIDPNVVLDKKGQPWLSYGSFWTGIKMRRIDPATGKLSTSDTKVYSLAARAVPIAGPQTHLPADGTIEAPFDACSKSCRN